MTTYLVLDAEYAIDHDAHQRYLDAERYDPADRQRLPFKDARLEPRWPFRRPVAISWLILAADDAGVLSPVTMRTTGFPERTEREMLMDLFADLSSYTELELVTWGGAATDIPQLLMAAMREGIKLPAFLVPMATSFDVRNRRHIDLMLAMCLGGARVHLAEVAAALDIPVKPIGAPGAVAGYIESGKWSLVKSVAESDVLTTAMVLMRHLALTTGTSTFAAAARLACFAAGMTHRPYAADFAQYRKRLIDTAFVEARATYDRIAA